MGCCQYFTPTEGGADAFTVEMPRLTMLMTSVSASTAQMLEGSSGPVAWVESPPTSSSGTPRYRAMFSRNCPLPLAHWLVMR